LAPPPTGKFSADARDHNKLEKTELPKIFVDAGVSFQRQTTQPSGVMRNFQWRRELWGSGGECGQILQPLEARGSGAKSQCWTNFAIF